MINLYNTAHQTKCQRADFLMVVWCPLLSESSIFFPRTYVLLLEKLHCRVFVFLCLILAFSEQRCLLMNIDCLTSGQTCHCFGLLGMYANMTQSAVQSYIRIWMLKYSFDHDFMKYRHLNFWRSTNMYESTKIETNL